MSTQESNTVLLKGLAGGSVELRGNSHALHTTRQEDMDWSAANPVTLEVEKELAELRPRLEHLSPTIGSIVHGVDLSKSLSGARTAALRRLLLERKAIFFRDQALTPEQHIDFTKKFGDLEIHPFSAPKEGYPELLAINHGKNSVGGENVFHSDVTWRQQPSLGSVLYAREVPKTGGDTLFVDMYAAYHAIPQTMAQVEDGTAQHDWHHFRNAQKREGVPDKQIASMQKQYPAQSHPVVRTHPETGRKALYVNPAFTTHIEGLPDEEQFSVLTQLYDLAKVPEFACRFHWENGSVAFWDNRCTQHYATSDYFPDRRVMDRATIIGDKPFYAKAAPCKSRL